MVARLTYDVGATGCGRLQPVPGRFYGTTDFYYEGWRVVEEHDGSDAILRQYTYGNYLDEVWTLDNRVGNTVA